MVVWGTRPCRQLSQLSQLLGLVWRERKSSVALSAGFQRHHHTTSTTTHHPAYQPRHLPRRHRPARQLWRSTRTPAPPREVRWRRWTRSSRSRSRRTWWWTAWPTAGPGRPRPRRSRKCPSPRGSSEVAVAAFLLLPAGTMSTDISKLLARIISTASSLPLCILWSNARQRFVSARRRMRRRMRRRICVRA